MECGASCPDPSELSALVNDTLSQERVEALLPHVGECAKCQSYMDDVSGTKTFHLEGLTEDSVHESDDSSLRQFVERVKEPITRVAHTNHSEGEDDLSFLTPSGDENSIGKLGALEVAEVIGRGGMGLVLRAVDPELQRSVAVKVLSPSLAASAPARERFIREARAAAAIHHENVLPIHAVDRSGELPYFTMPLIEGKSLQEVLDERNAPMPHEKLVDLASKIASGLAAAHDQGLIHRDIKPANILLDKDESRVWIADFGLARALEEPSVTLAGTLVGTPQFMAPEQLDDEPPSERSDLFSLGSVLYYMATGRPAFAAKSTASTIRKVIEAHPEAATKVNPNLPNWLGALIRKLLNKDPARRPDSAEYVVDTIAKHSQRSPRSKLRSRLLVAAGAVISGILLVALWPTPIPKPFQLNSNGKVYATLTEAVEAAQDEDIIEIVESSVRITERIDLGDKAITIRSSDDDARTILNFTPSPGNATGRLPGIETQADLTLSGVILARADMAQGNPNDMGYAPLILFLGERLQIQRCRFELGKGSQSGAPPATVVLLGASVCEVSDSTFLHRNRGIAILSRTEDDPSATSTRITLNRNIIIGGNSCLTFDHRHAHPLHLAMIENMIASRVVLVATPKHTWADVHAEQVDSNCFYIGNFRNCLIRVYNEELFRKHFHWTGQGNTVASSAEVIPRIPMMRAAGNMRVFIWNNTWDGWSDQISEKNMRKVFLRSTINVPRKIRLREVDARALIPDEIVLPEIAQ